MPCTLRRIIRRLWPPPLLLATTARPGTAPLDTVDLTIMTFFPLPASIFLGEDSVGCSFMQEPHAPANTLRAWH